MIVLTRLSLLPPDHWERNVELSQKIGHIVTQEHSGEDCNVGQERCDTILKYSKCPGVTYLIALSLSNTEDILKYISRKITYTILYLHL